VFAAENEKKVLNRFLYSESLNDRQKAFDIIVSSENKYRNIVLRELKKHSTKPAGTPDALIYLAAVIKDQRYIQPLTSLINNVDYSSKHCIYSCPIVFSLVIFGTVMNHSLPTLDEKLTAVSDLKSEAKRVRGISIKPEKASKYMEGPAVDQLLAQLETLPLADVIKLAGPHTQNGNKRLAAAVVLQAHVTDAEYLKDLYWLAIAELPNDASGEYRNAIHWAIYRAETSRNLKRT